MKETHGLWSATVCRQYQAVLSSLCLFVTSHHYTKLIRRWDSERELFTTTPYTYYEIQKREQTRNTFCGTWYLPHSHVHNERTVPIIIAGCMAHEREGYISTSGLKSDVTVVFLDPDFL